MFRNKAIAKRIISVAIVLMIIAMAWSVVVLAEHECNHSNCRTCRFIDICIVALTNILAAVWISVSKSILTALVIFSVILNIARSLFQTPITLKVKFSC